MKKLLFAVALFSALNCDAQLSTPVGGGSNRATVSERIGLTTVTIDYGRPAVNGRDGKI